MGDWVKAIVIECLDPNQERRVSAEQLLEHPFFHLKSKIVERKPREIEFSIRSMGIGSVNTHDIDDWEWPTDSATTTLEEGTPKMKELKSEEWSTGQMSLALTT